MKGKEEAGILRFEAVPSLSLILMGSMDWLTTIIGIGFFGAVESNPFMAGLIGTSVITFSAVKLATTVFVAFLFYKADKALFAFPDKNSRSFMFTRVALRAAYIMATTLLLAAVVNNLLVVAKAF